MAYSRIDHSTDLIHFTKDKDEWGYEESYRRFYEILQEGKLKSSSAKRIGEVSSICFTEAPIRCLTAKCELNKKYFKTYSPFGFMFSKEYIFRLGGRPVIYSHPSDYESNCKYIQWRTVSYNPLSKDGIFRDFTWEREWRIRPDDGKLILHKEVVKLVFPSEDWIRKFREDHDRYHQDPNCECQCIRSMEIIKYDEYMSIEKHEELSGSCPDTSLFPWILINMECKNIPPPG